MRKLLFVLTFVAVALYAALAFAQSNACVEEKTPTFTVFQAAKMCVLEVDSIALGDGTSGAPSLSFSGDQNTGFYSGGSDQFLASVGGSNVLQIVDNGGVPQINIAAGTQTKPGLGFIADPDTGLYRNAENFMALTTGGTPVLEIRGDNDIRMLTSGAGIVLRSPDGSYSKCTVDNSDNFSCAPN